MFQESLLSYLISHENIAACQCPSENTGPKVSLQYIRCSLTSQEESGNSLNLSASFWVFLDLDTISIKIVWSKICVFIACKFNISAIKYRFKNIYLLSFSQIFVYKSCLSKFFLKSFIFSLSLVFGGRAPKLMNLHLCLLEFLLPFWIPIL